MFDLFTFVVGVLVGYSMVWILDFIDYTYFDYYLKKRFFPRSRSIIVLDDEETWDTDAFFIKVSDDEISRLMEGESVRDVVDDLNRWRDL